jgi:hypothetical protein
MFVCMHAGTYVYIDIDISICISRLRYRVIDIEIEIEIDIDASISISIDLCISIYLCVYLSIYIYVYIYTQRHAGWHVGSVHPSSWVGPRALRRRSICAADGDTVVTRIRFDPTAAPAGTVSTPCE